METHIVYLLCFLVPTTTPWLAHSRIKGLYKIAHANHFFFTKLVCNLMFSTQFNSAFKHRDIQSMSQNNRFEIYAIKPLVHRLILIPNRFHVPHFLLGHNGLITFSIFMRVCQIDAKGQIIAKEGNYQFPRLRVEALGFGIWGTMNDV